MVQKKQKTSKPAAPPKASKKSPTVKKDFLVVGLGASAGGVKALQDFFATMPPNSGMAFVVILHLSPEHESNLGEIIQARTPIPVTIVNETHRVEPNNVYVIPPNRQLEMVDGVVRCTPLQGERGERVAIDIFFRTLAEEYREKAVCVVLSGTGTDGTQGLKAVKEANGFAVVQDPHDAEHESMPRSAIATQLADWILPVREMPEKLLQFRDSSARLHLTDDGADGKIALEIQADESLREILTVLRVRTGHDFSKYKTPTLVRRIARHLQIHDLEDIPAYLEFLREKPDEIQSLLKNLLINVTNFFRDKDAWTALEQTVVPNLFAGKKAGDTVRVWSCGCASGEEAYSLAMVLSEYAGSLPDPPKIQVFATDVDEDAIAEAREHRYTMSIEADVSPARLKRFFIKEGKYYRVKKELRETVLLAPHNVLRDPPFSKLDLIACRNLLIYLNRDTQARVMEIFHFALNPHGYLFLGSSETAEAVPELFATVDKKLRLYARRPAITSHQPAPSMPVAGRWEIRIPELKFGKKGEHRPSSLGDVHFRLLEQYAPPSALINQDFDIQYLSESAGRFMQIRGGEPTSNILKLILPDLLPDLRAALFSAQREKKSTEFTNVLAVIEGKEINLNIIVRPVNIENVPSDYLLVIFDEDRKFVLPDEGEKKPSRRLDADREDAMESVVRRLEEELARTKEHLRTTIEQHEVSVEELKASNEELQAINEELRSTTEELETSKEELQSVNEELTTVNHELKEKMDETTRTNSDLQNLMASTDIATIFLDRDFRIKRYTTPVEYLFNVTKLDIGRPLEHFTHRLNYPDLVKDAATVLRLLTPLEREINDSENRFYLTRFVPYRTVDDRIEGVVLNFIEITERKRDEETLSEELRGTRILQTLATRLVTEGITQTIYDEINAAAIEITRADAGTLQMLDPETGELVLLAASNLSPEMNDHLRRIDVRANLASGERSFMDFEPPGTDDEDAPPPVADRLLAAQSTPLISRSGKPIGMVTTHWRVSGHRPSERELRFLDLLARQAADLIERHAAQEALSESEEKYRTLFESIDIGFCVIEIIFDDQGKPFDYRFLEANPASIAQTGFTDVIGKTILELAPEQENFWFETYGEIAMTGKPARFEHRVSALNSWYEVYAFRIGEPEERRVAVLFRDVALRRRAEAALHKSEEQLKLILESTKDYAIITFDLKGMITRWNAGAERIFGYTEQEALGKFTSLIFTPEDRKGQVPEKELAATLKHGRAEDERWHLRKDGSRFYASGVMQLLRDGEIEGFVKICRDQTARLEAEQTALEKEMLRRLVTAQEDERRRIARDIHDHFGQQITALRLKLNAIKKAALDNPEVNTHADDAEKAAAALDANVDFIAWELRPAALDDLGLRAALANFVNEWSRHTGIRAEFHASGLSRTRLDYEIETNLYRIAQEALNNIQKHARAGHVSVLLEKSRNKVSLIIEDDGSGFSPTDKATRKKGIGIVGMTERAKICGGELEIESAKGKGTTVFARIPTVRGMRDEG